MGHNSEIAMPIRNDAARGPIVRRREFIGLLSGAAATWPFAVRGQQTDRVRRVGVLVNSSENDLEKQSELRAFRARMEELGWSEGRNIRFDYRWTDGDFDRLSPYAAELVNLSPDAILATNAPTLVALQKETSSIPLVFVQVFDPVSEAFVPSLSHPGGKLLGLLILSTQSAENGCNCLRR